MLKRIGRSHNESQIYETIDSLPRAVGFHNISIDLIYALPGQTMDQVVDNVAKALLDIPHLSLYSLILENHTVFMNRQNGRLHLPGEDVESEDV